MDEQATTDSGGMAILARIIGLFSAPRATFSSLVESIDTVDIVVPVLIVLALGTGFIFNSVFLWPRQSGSQSGQLGPKAREITMKRAHQLAQDQQAVA